MYPVTTRRTFVGGACVENAAVVIMTGEQRTMRRTRVRRSVATWRDIIARHRQGGMTITEFCRREGIHVSLFRRWRRMLGGSGHRTRRRIVRPAAPPAAPFIELGALRPANSPRSIRLELGHGIVLHLSGE